MKDDGKANAHSNDGRADVGKVYCVRRHGKGYDVINYVHLIILVLAEFR